MARHYASTRFPTTPHDLGEALADAARFAEIFPEAGPEAWGDFEAAYAAASPTIVERQQLAVQQALQGVGAAVPKGLAGKDPDVRPANRLYAKRAPGVRTEGILPADEFPFARMTWAANKRNENAQAVALRARLGDATHTAFANATLGERVPSEGGFLVPENLRSNLLELILEQSIVRPRAMIVPMDSLRVPFPSIDDESHETTVYGGVAGYWTAEGAALSATAPTFARFELEARKLTTYTTIPNELLTDAMPLLEMWLRTTWPRAMAWFEDVAFISGSGVGEPQGFLNSAAAIKVATGTSHVITLADVISAYTRLLPECLTSDSLVWMCSPDAKGQLMQMALTASSTTIAPPSWLAGMQAIEGVPATLFGHQLIVSEKMPSSLVGNTTTAGALALVDLNFYLVGDRQSVQMASSEEYLFGNDLVAYRMIERLDGRSWRQSSLQPFNGGPTLSPIVLVDTTS